MSSIFIKDTGLKVSIRKDKPEGSVKFAEYSNLEAVERVLHNAAVENPGFAYMQDVFSGNGSLRIKGVNKYASRIRAAAKTGVMERDASLKNAMPSKSALQRMRKADIASIGGVGETKAEMIASLV